jgi:hypothetical protein
MTRDPSPKDGWIGGVRRIFMTRLTEEDKVLGNVWATQRTGNYMSSFQAFPDVLLSLLGSNLLQTTPATSEASRLAEVDKRNAVTAWKRLTVPIFSDLFM